MSPASGQSVPLNTAELQLVEVWFEAMGMIHLCRLGSSTAKDLAAATASTLNTAKTGFPRRTGLR
jgi:hypothetical protein